MSIRCYARRMKDKDEFKSSRQGSPFCFWHELRCDKMALPGQKLCNDCVNRTVTNYDKKTHKYQTAWVHGLIDEAIPEWSILYDGPEYHRRVSKYGAPSCSEMARAKKAQQVARQDKALEGITETLARLSLEQKSQEQTPVQTPVQVVEPKPKPKRTSKKKTEAPKAAVTSVPVKAVESTELPLTNVEVYKIQVKRFMIGDKHYFLDPKKYKVYTRISDTLPGAYVGRWDPTEEQLDSTFPDSDQE